MRRLFAVRPSDIHEHPPGLPTDPALVPTGPVPGWEAYAVDFARSGGERVFGPFDPVIERSGDGDLFIAGSRRGHDDDRFYFNSPYRWGEALRDDPAWHQSMTTLRFIRKPGADR